MTAMVRMATLKLEGETENMGVCTKVLCDDDVYYCMRDVMFITMSARD